MMQYQGTLDTMNYDVPEKKQKKKTKPHVIRRNIEDYLEERALKRRIIDIYDDDFLLES